ncbi:glycoside hydrolase family 3 N-terminal domain-containing protein [Oligoflexus tunisiensis]|uniref:glycoside hydrolase family 3 N-terminal domain-containing protein n=1 Tax=Oligoflexus tunisiensis TaxID=708132 RepID=UPI000AA530D4|nr:glycoside hydrolase family 3 N-terminal domain-containing protein [Oligoflexus tunisiensis]
MSPDQASAVILAALEGISLSAEEQKCFQRLPPAGFTLFRRNLSPEFARVRRLCTNLQALVDANSPPMMLAIDQEGGRVARLRQPFPDGGPAMLLAEGRVDTDALLTIENHGYIVGSALAGLGLNVNFAPVVDVLSNEDNTAIGDRCFGRSSEAVTQRAFAYLHGLQASGVLGCLKHFPGQGDAGADTHEQGTMIDVSMETLLARELVPFLALMNECPMVMISHAIYPALDPEQPASLSSKVMQGFVRDRLKYKGLIVTDDMNMKAIAQDRESWTGAVVASVAAGADLVLVCRELDRYRWAVDALAREAQRSFSFHRRMNEAMKRVYEVRQRLKR